MTLSEKEIEDLIFDSVVQKNGLDILNRGLELPFQRNAQAYGYMPKIIWERQLGISPYGIIDIVGFYRLEGRLFIDLYELKAVPIEAKDFEQVFRYKKGLEVYAKQTFKSCQDTQVNCVLIGNGYNSGQYIQNNSLITVIEFEYSILGINFKTHRTTTAWAMTNDDHCNFRNLINKPQNPLIKLKSNTNGKAVY